MARRNFSQFRDDVTFDNIYLANISRLCISYSKALIYPTYYVYTNHSFQGVFHIRTWSYILCIHKLQYNYTQYIGGYTDHMHMYLPRQEVLKEICH